MLHDKIDKARSFIKKFIWLLTVLDIQEHDTGISSWQGPPGCLITWQKSIMGTDHMQKRARFEMFSLLQQLDLTRNIPVIADITYSHDTALIN